MAVPALAGAPIKGPSSKVMRGIAIYMSRHNVEHPPLCVERLTTVFSVGVGGGSAGTLSASRDQAWPLVMPISSAILPNDAPLLRCAAAFACNSCRSECCITPRVWLVVVDKCRDWRQLSGWLGWYPARNGRVGVLLLVARTSTGRLAKGGTGA